MGMDRIVEKKAWPMKRVLTYGAAGIFILLVLYLLIFQNGSSLQVNPERITISKVTSGPFLEFIPVIGNILPHKTVYLVAEEGGRVETLFLEVGAQVKAGDKILKLSNTGLLMTLLNNEAQVNRASNDLRATRLQLERNRLDLKKQCVAADYSLLRSKRKFERYAALFEKKIISQEDYDDFKDEYEYQVKNQALTLENLKTDLSFQEQQVRELNISVQKMEASLDLLRAQMESLTVRAPISGQLTSLTVEKGQSTQPGERFGQIDELQGFKVKAKIDEHYLQQVEMGKPGKFDVSAKTYDLSISKVLPEVKEGLFEVELEFIGTEPPGIRRGQSIHIRLELGEMTQALLLERGAFYQHTGGNWVYVINEQEQNAEKRTIRIGRQNPHFFEVLEGLKPGERVITSAYDNFGDKDKLLLK